MDNLSKIELGIISKVIIPSIFDKLYHKLWNRVKQTFGLLFHSTQLEYGFVRAIPDPRALEYLQYRQFILSEKTKEKLIGDLRYQLLEGMKSSEGIDQIKRRLDTVFKGSEVNTERIARTETLNAMNAGRLEAYEASEVTHYKMWRAAINNKRTAEDSRRLHGQIQELSDPFVDPKTGEGVMHPPNRPNCRCTMIPLRKLPENVVYKSGQMYAADEMVGKIEIDITSLNKTEKRIWIKPTAKRKGHYRKVKGAKKVEEPKFAMDRLKSIIPNVYLEGATESQLNSIADGIEETIGKFPEVKVNSIGWSTPDDRYMYGSADAAYVPATRGGSLPRIFFDKDVILDVISWLDETDKKFNSRKNLNIEYYTDMIKLHTQYGDAERLVMYKEKLNNINSCSRLFVNQSEKDKIKGLVIHECYHAIDVQLNLKNIFSDQLEKYGVTDKDKMQVSDYAASKDTELWAEVGSAVQSGVDIPDSVRKAFDATMETIQ